LDPNSRISELAAGLLPLVLASHSPKASRDGNLAVDSHVNIVINKGFDFVVRRSDVVDRLLFLHYLTQWIDADEVICHEAVEQCAIATSQGIAEVLFQCDEFTLFCIRAVHALVPFIRLNRWIGASFTMRVRPFQFVFLEISIEIRWA